MDPLVEPKEGNINIDGERMKEDNEEIVSDEEIDSNVEIESNEEIEKSAKAAEWLAEQANDVIVKKKRETDNFGTEGAEGKLTNNDDRRLRKLARLKFGYGSYRYGREEVPQDPLQHWMVEVNKMKESGNERGYFFIVKRCFRTFTVKPFLFPAYQNDPRFLRICISYSKMCFSPCSVFHHMYKLGVGTKQPLFWVEWGLNEGADMDALAGTGKDGNEIEEREIEVDQGQNKQIPAVAAQSSKKRRRLNEAVEEGTEVEDDLFGHTARDRNWEVRYEELVSYTKEHGNANVPRKYERNLALSAWVKSQREMFKTDKLSQERIDRLYKIGFVFILKPGWDARYAELTAFVRDHEHANVPQRFKQNPGLGAWVDTQRTMFKQNKLSDERTSCLRKVGFEFSKQEHLGWDARYAELVAYSREHGSTIIPPNYDKNTSLCAWVLAQRRMFNENELSQERISLLQEIGFEFSLDEKRWDARYAELVVYVYVHGNANVPRKHPENPTLGIWVDSQRKRLRENKLSQERLRRLRDIGFEFSLRREQPGWDSRYTDLVAYATENGDTNVPLKYKEKPELGMWVDAQRTSFRKNNLSQERMNRLNEIGFEFPD